MRTLFLTLMLVSIALTGTFLAINWTNRNPATIKIITALVAMDAVLLALWLVQL